jgi:5-methylcytosine-specific restriction protein A
MDRILPHADACRDVEGPSIERYQRHGREDPHLPRWSSRSVKLSTVCGVATSRPGSRCTVHARQSNRSRHNALYSTRTWQRLSARVIARHRGQRGNWCPGYQRAAHPASDLTVDHVVPLAAGGAPLDIGNLAVLCRSCNSTKGASEPVSVARVASLGIVVDADRGGVPHRPTRTLPDRARRLCAHGRLWRFFPGRQGDVRPGAPQRAHVAR